MKQPNLNLGLCFFGNQLFYAVNKTEQPEGLARIGAVDFNFNVSDAILEGRLESINGIRKSISQLQNQYQADHINILCHPRQECWTTLPKVVYDESDEREAYINILMNGVDRGAVEATWHPLSNQDYRFLVLRNKSNLQGLEQLISTASAVEFISDFEIGERWIRHTGTNGSFLNIGCFNGCITVCSFILGKLRGATCLAFDDPEDLPYLWLHATKQLHWMQGLHEEIYVYGFNAFRTIEILEPFWDDAGQVIKMNSLNAMHVSADEDTYSFDLEQAFPAVLLAMEFNGKKAAYKH